jgi:uncharacterized peroxidase-related enzyme
MAFIRTIAPQEATGETRSMYERQQRHYGYVPNYAQVFCYRPELMKLWADLQAGIRRHIEPRRFGLVTVAAARALRSSYCSLAHGRALTEFFSVEDVCAIADGDGSGPLSAAEQAMMEFAGRVAVDAASVSAAEVDVLRTHGFSDAEIFDIAAAAAARAFFTKVVDGLGAQPDSAYHDLDTALKAALTVGRPIAAPAADPEPPALSPI